MCYCNDMAEKPAVERKAVAFKTKDGREVNFSASGVRKSNQQRKEKYKEKVIAEYEKNKRKEAREAKKATAKPVARKEPIPPESSDDSNSSGSE